MQCKDSKPQLHILLKMKIEEELYRILTPIK